MNKLRCETPKCKEPLHYDHPGPFSPYCVKCHFHAIRTALEYVKTNPMTVSDMYNNAELHSLVPYPHSCFLLTALGELKKYLTVSKKSVS